MKRILISAIIFLSTLFLYSQNNDSSKLLELQRTITTIKEKYAPDKRVNIFDITIDNQNSLPILKGITTDKVAYEILLKEIEKKNINIANEIEVLPAKDLDDKTYGVIKLSVADIRTANKFSAEMATQAILGTPIRVLQKDDWYRIQTPDGYIGWAQLSAFQPMTLNEVKAWNEASKVVFTDYFGFSYQEPNTKSQHVSDLVATNMLKLEGEIDEFYKVSYPDGRQAYVLKEQAMPYESWVNSKKLTGESLVNEAYKLMGIPYVWGGTSVKGMDCSGLTKTVLLMHGIILTRDASQQAYTGIPVDISKGYDNLQIGDLMFFGKKAENNQKERVRHVAFYLGNNKFIHASGLVRVSSLDPSNPDYDELNTKEFIRAIRIIGAVDKQGSNIWSIEENPFYN